MQIATIQKTLKVLELKRDECPVIFSNAGNVDAFKKHLKASRRVLAGIPMAKDPAILLKKTRIKRGMV